MVSPIAVQRFEQKYIPEPTSGCWLWIGALTQGGLGYGVMTINQRRVTAHRLSWEIEYGPVPPGLSVLHKCDVRSCVNPQHLFLGTKTDNMQDMVSKGRHFYQKKDRCKRGHPFSHHNGRQRRCKICERLSGIKAVRKYRAKLKNRTATQ